MTSRAARETTSGSRSLPDTPAPTSVNEERAYYRGAREIAQAAMSIAAEICIYTNANLSFEEL